MSKRYKRKYLVDARFQLRQVVVLIIANLLLVSLISALLSWFYLIVWDGSTAYNHNQLIPVYVAVFALLVICCTVIFSLRRSRSIAGMMKKLQLVLEDAALGVVPEKELTFRKSDYFKQLATPLNDCFALIRASQNVDTTAVVKELKDIHAELDSETADTRRLQDRIESLIEKIR